MKEFEVLGRIGINSTYTSYGIFINTNGSIATLPASVKVTTLKIRLLKPENRTKPYRVKVEVKACVEFTGIYVSCS